MSKDLALWLGFGLLGVLFLGLMAASVVALGWKWALGLWAAVVVLFAVITGASMLIAWGLTS